MTADEGRTHRFGGAIVAIVAVTALIGALSILFVLRQPWLPGHFESGNDNQFDYITAAGEDWHDPVISSAKCPVASIALNDHDLDLFKSLTGKDNQAVVQRLAQVRCVLAAKDAVLHGTDETNHPRAMPFSQRPRRLTDLDLRFWPPWIISLTTFLMAATVWRLRPGEGATRLFAINGFAGMASFMSIAIYAAHLPGSDPRVFWAWLAVNHTANQVFFLSLIALFSQYPRRLVPAGWAWGALVLAVPFAIADVMEWLPETLAAHILPIVELVMLLGLIGWQWVATRRAPRDRAALMWLGLAVAVGASLWLGLLASILITGRTGDAGSILALILVFPFYVGLAMGVARFCLVELQDWTFRILFFIVAAIMFVAVDAALIALTGVKQGPATAMALLLIAFGYLPLRDLVWRRLFRGKVMSQPEMFAAVMDIVFAPTPAQRSGKWQGLLQGLFQPLRLEPALAAPAEALIAEEGLRLDIPAVAESPALSLAMAREGRELFSPSQLALVTQLVRLVRTASQSRDAYERGASEERRRLAQDLHDDVGARLMSGLSVADDRTRPILHGALSDIRAIAGGMVGQAAPLDKVLADIRQECVRRFEAASLETEWTPWPEDGPLILLDYRLQKALASSIRETASNIIRHAGARHVTVTIALDGDRLTASITDDGKGLSETVLSGDEGGQGLKGLQRRLAEAGGTFRFGNNANPPGAWVNLTLPLMSKGAP